MNFEPSSSTSWSTSKTVKVTVTDENANEVDAGSLKYLWSTATSGIGEGSFTGDNSGTFSSGGNITGPFVTGNNWNLWILAKDKSGNTKIQKSAGAYYFDNSIPSVTKAETDPSGWSTGNKKIKLTASETGSGVAGYMIKQSSSKPSKPGATDTSWVPASANPWTSTVTYGAETNYYAFVKDGAGNVSDAFGPFSVGSIDTSNPTISVTADNTNAAKSHTMTIKIADTGSGLASANYTIKYRWTKDATTPTWTTSDSTTSINVDTAGKAEATATLSRNGVTETAYLHVQIQNLKDVAGHTVASATAKASCILDNQGPTISFNPDGGESWATLHQVILKFSDNGGSTVNENSLRALWSTSSSGIDASTLTSEGGHLVKVAGVYRLSGDISLTGKYYLWIYVEDNLGNSSVERTTKTFWFDHTKPNNQAPSATSTDNSITISFAQTDDHSGIDDSSIRYAYKLSSSISWSDWGTSATINGLQYGTSYDVKTKANDRVGNGEVESIAKTGIETEKETSLPTTDAPQISKAPARDSYMECHQDDESGIDESSIEWQVVFVNNGQGSDWFGEGFAYNVSTAETRLWSSFEYDDPTFECLDGLQLAPHNIYGNISGGSVRFKFRTRCCDELGNGPSISSWSEEILADEFFSVQSISLNSDGIGRPYVKISLPSQINGNTENKKTYQYKIGNTPWIVSEKDATIPCTENNQTYYTQVLAENGDILKTSSLTVTNVNVTNSKTKSEGED